MAASRPAFGTYDSFGPARCGRRALVADVTFAFRLVGTSIGTGR